MRPSERGSPALTCRAGDIQAPKAIVLRLLCALGFDGVRRSVVARRFRRLSDDEQTRRQALKRL